MSRYGIPPLEETSAYEMAGLIVAAGLGSGRQTTSVRVLFERRGRSSREDESKQQSQRNKVGLRKHAGSFSGSILLRVQLFLFLFLVPFVALFVRWLSCFFGSGHMSVGVVAYMGTQLDRQNGFLGVWNIK